jgi:hypothetical protein
VELRQTLAIMLRQLKNERLDVVLVAAPDARHSEHKIRTVQNENPWWYRELCSRHTKSRSDKRKRGNHSLHDTRIGRKRTMQTLTTLSSGGVAVSIYANELLDLAREQEEIWRVEEEDE